MSNEEQKIMTIDELLEEQSITSRAATVEAIPDQPSLVKVTPWLKDKGCNCSSAITVAKKSIKTVKPTGQTHYCCGKVLMIVEIEFEEKATISVNDLFESQVEKLISDNREEAQFPFDFEEEAYSDQGKYLDPDFPENSQADETYESSSLHGHYSQNFGKHPSILCGGHPCDRSRYSCIACGGAFNCVRHGSSCCGRTICPPNYRCTPYRGRLVCLRRRNYKHGGIVY